jgi:hypothetical protein
MMLLVINKQTYKYFLLINEKPWLRVVSSSVAWTFQKELANSLITIQVDTLEDIKELRKTFAPVVHKQPELHLGELVRDYFPQIFFKHEV